MKAAIPYNEAERLEALRKYEILDTPDESAYDDLAMLAASICGTPVGAVCFVDECRMWLKARRGLERREADRDLSFCAHAILRPDQVFVVPDADHDPRFVNNDLVRGRTPFKFYAGAALVNSEGHALGTLFVVDHRPKPILTAQVEALQALSRQVMAQLELRRAEIALRRQADTLMKAQEDSKSASKAKTTFLANISHEIRTPMNGVVGITSLLLGTPLSERQRHYVQTIEKSAEGLLHVLSNIVEFAKNEALTAPAEMAIIELPAFIDDIANMMRPMAMAKQIRFIASVDEELHRPLMGDPMRLQQVLLNLVGNALKFTSQGTVEISVSLQSEGPNGMIVRFETRDTGIGISADRLEAIFEEFTQIDAGTQRKFSGAGLGLSISRQLARIMGTEVKVKSEVGLGSTFWFDVEMPLPIGPTTPTEVYVGPDGPHIRLPRVLVAEDNEVNSLVVASMLEHNGCEVVCVDNGEDALKAVNTQPFDLVFMDVQMPRMDGVEATRAIRALQGPGRTVPIVALTASVLREDAIMCQTAGMDDFISKPINEKVITAALKRWIVRSDAGIGL